MTQNGKPRYNYLIVGSGFFGAVVAEQLRRRGKSVLVLEKRNHIGGNCFTYDFEDTRISVHKYGTHIFHTNDERVWNYVNRFTEFNRYQHRVLTTYRERVYAMPISLGTINTFYNLNLKPEDVPAFIASKRPELPGPANLEEKAISLIGVELYEAFIKGYTMKQWGCSPCDLPPEIITRLPVRASYYDSYFDDLYQGIPVHGYTPIFERMLEGTPVELNTDFFVDRDYWMSRADRLVYTGPIDSYFDYCFGELSYRSVRFELEKVPVEDYQGTSVMNYADLNVPYTRIHEPKHLHREKKFAADTSVIIREYSQMDRQEPYYPVNFSKDRCLLEKYQALAQQEPQTTFGGRLAQYKYYDMHQVIAAALHTSSNLP
jgi:UDP-galactopyranose mutase